MFAKARLADLTIAELDQSRAAVLSTLASAQSYRDPRTHLFGKEPTGVCDPCGRHLPTGFLVAAHIKRRESCSDAERKSIDVVMRACKRGCDELFERGYIYVDSRGIIQSAPNLEKATTDLKQAAATVIGKETTAFREATSLHFK